jgi:hypothetical protein
MTNKICTGCNLEKPFGEFGKDKNAKFGLNQKCKICCRARKNNRSEAGIEKAKRYRAEWQRKKRPILNARLRQRYENNLEENREQSRERTRKYLQSEKGKAQHLKVTKEYERNNPEKIRAQRKVRKAILSGKIFRSETCNICKIICKTHAHHEDYNKPLEIIWMCPKCHLYHHQKYRFHAKRLNEKTPNGDAKV